jgi:serine/threonine protein phosphatase PrpC
MEDASIHETDLGDGNSLFAVFDGHGGTCFFNIGHEVSKYVQAKFVKLLTS